MKVEKADFVWAVFVLITVGVTFHFGILLYGLLGIYASMVLLFGYHIRSIKKRIENSEAAYGKILSYRTENSLINYYYPEVEFETEDGELISAMYRYPDREKKYEIGDEELIHYSPDDPMFFYFADREKELTEIYYRSIIIGGIIAAVVAVAIIILSI